ncbi:Hypothetical protein A7982_08318 [Minicystis rosea]|nr:Hypothetical protein A7982_08318 [Minicystis rosea]
MRVPPLRKPRHIPCGRNRQCRTRLPRTVDEDRGTADLAAKYVTHLRDVRRPTEYAASRARAAPPPDTRVDDVESKRVNAAP